MNKILVIGCCGSGKSTLATKLHQKLNLDLIHLDQHYFGPNWLEPSKEVWAKRVTELVQRPQWIMDGNYGGTFDIRFPKADTIIYMDIPTHICLYRVIKRTWKYLGKNRPDMQPGCKERFDPGFLHYVLMYKRLRYKAHMELLNKVKDEKQVFILKNDKDVTHLVDSIPIANAITLS